MFYFQNNSITVFFPGFCFTYGNVLNKLIMKQFTTGNLVHDVPSTMDTYLTQDSIRIFLPGGRGWGASERPIYDLAHKLIGI